MKNKEMNKQERYEYLLSQGFLKNEAKQLSKTSDAGMQASYFQTLIRSRRALQAHAKKEEWTDKQYRKHIRQQYIGKGYYKTDIKNRKINDVWKLLRSYEDESRQKGQKYSSPWKQKGHISVRKPRKGTPARARQDRIQLLESRLKTIDKDLPNARGAARQALETERRQRTNEISKLKGML